MRQGREDSSIDEKTHSKCKNVDGKQTQCTDYHLTQALPGHGFFKAYQIGKTDGNDHYCGKLDTAEHTLFECEGWIVVDERAPK